MRPPCKLIDDLSDVVGQMRHQLQRSISHAKGILEAAVAGGPEHGEPRFNLADLDNQAHQIEELERLLVLLEGREGDLLVGDDEDDPSE